MIRNFRNFRGGLIGAVALLWTQMAAAQTAITPPQNKYSPADDVKLGQEAAAQVRQQMPILNDAALTSYLSRIGDRLVAAIPPNLQHPEFHYSFAIVNVREINAFALPGGPMFVNRGMMQAATDEGEIAGVMAHELSHVALRHGTAQATKATKYEIGEIAGAVLGAIVGGTAGNVIAQGTQFGIGTYFLKFSREYEKQADLLGAQIMARAGYDPMDMANMFKTIEAQGGSGGPQWLSDHPNPGNRIQYITAEARSLQVVNPVHDTAAFEQMKTAFRNMPQAPTTEQVAKEGAGRTGRTSGQTGTSGRITPGQVQPPSSRYTQYDEGNVFRVSVPSNWRELSGNNAVTFAPDGAFGDNGGQSVFTHGVQIGLARNETHDLQTATDELVQSLAQSNPRLSRAGSYNPASIGQLRGLQTMLTNVSDVTGTEERIAVLTAQLPDGNLFYMLGVAPADDFGQYQTVFRKIAQSIQIAQ
jgi:hypothetical protein